VFLISDAPLLSRTCLAACEEWQRNGARGVLKHKKVDTRLPGKGISNAHGARPVNQIISMIKRIRTSRFSTKTLSSGLKLTLKISYDIVSIQKLSGNEVYYIAWSLLVIFKNHAVNLIAGIFQIETHLK